jgi:surface antigen
MLALMVGGCSFSYQLDSLWTKSENDIGHTGSIRPAGVRSNAAVLSDNDLAVARAAVSDALAKGGMATSTPWENPRTGARGAIMPIASAYSQDGSMCQDILASYLREGMEAWLQGEACQAEKGRWTVRRLKPWGRN